MRRERFVATFQKLIGRIRSSILRENNLNSALALARWYGGLRWWNSDGVYADDELENMLTNRVWDVLALENNVREQHPGGGIILIASELHNRGGHSAVVKKWLGLMAPFHRHTLIVTRSVTDEFAREVKGMGVELVICDGDDLAVIRKMLRVGRDARTVVMHIHPDDIVAAIAARLLKRAGCDCLFYNHADHAFSYGIGVGDVVCEISEFGHAISERSKRVQGRSVYLGIPLSSPAQQSDKAIRCVDGERVRILSCGDAYKYRPADGYFFGDFIDELIRQVPEAEIIIVGPNGRENWWQERLGVWGTRVRFMGTLARDDYEALLETADVYVDSFPVTGGTAFPEALLRGKACAALKNPCQGYSVADVLRVDDVEQLVHKVQAILRGDEMEQQAQESVRKEVSARQSETAFKEQVERLYNREWPDRYTSGMRKAVGLDPFWFEKAWQTSAVIRLPYLHQGQSGRLSIRARMRLLFAVSGAFFALDSPRSFASLVRALAGCRKQVRSHEKQ